MTLKNKKLLVITPHFQYFIKDAINQYASYFKNIKIIIPVPYFYKIVTTIPLINNFFQSATLKFSVDKSWKNKVFYAKFLTLPKFFKGVPNTCLATKATLKLVRNKKIDFDLIHSHFLSHGYIGSALKKMEDKPLVVSAHGHDVYHTPFRPDWQDIAKFVYQYADKIITPSEFNAKKLLPLGIARSKISIIPNGYDDRLFKPISIQQARSKLRLPLRKKILVCVASLVPAKGHEYLIEAMKVISKQREDVVLMLVGSGFFATKLLKKIRKLNLEKKVSILGRRPHEEIPLWMNAADIIVLPSISESFGTVIPEALACGKPVVASQVGGIPEIIKNEELGFLVKPRDPEALAEALLEALEKKWNHEYILKYVSRYSYKNIVNHILRVYMELV